MKKTVQRFKVTLYINLEDQRLMTVNTTFLFLIPLSKCLSLVYPKLSPTVWPAVGKILIKHTGISDVLHELFLPGVLLKCDLKNLNYF